MSEQWQLVLALLCVAVALTLALRRLWRFFQRGEPTPCCLPIPCRGCPFSKLSGLSPSDRDECSWPGPPLSTGWDGTAGNADPPDNEALTGQDCSEGFHSGRLASTDGAAVEEGRSGGPRR